jgi:hypothetical protein
MSRQFDPEQFKVAKQFDEDFHTPAFYYMQLLAFAQRVPYEKLGFERQRFKPECLTRYAEAVPSSSTGLPRRALAKAGAWQSRSRQVTISL